jgi:large subunit ribosomal protein L24
MANKVNSKVKLHVKKGDTVKVLAGDDKGKSGKVLRMLPSTNRAVVVCISKLFLKSSSIYTLIV